MYSYKFLIPEALDVDEHLRRFPTEIRPFKLEKMLYCIQLIITIPARNKDVNEVDGYIPIHSKTLQDMIGRSYHEYLSYLVATGVLLCNGWHHEGVSRKYKFHPDYDKGGIREYEYGISKWLESNLTGVKKRKKRVSPDQLTVGSDSDVQANVLERLPLKSKFLTLTEKHEYNTIMRGKFPHVYKWFDEGDILIDSGPAHRYNETIYKMREVGFLKKEFKWNKKVKAMVGKYPRNQYYQGLVNIRDIESKEYMNHFDTSVFRYYSSLTMMPKDLRGYIKWGNQPLIAIDIKNSQPYLLSLLTNPNFWSIKGTELNTLSIYNLPYNESYTNHYPIPDLITLCNFLARQPERLELYKQAVSSGELYEIMKGHLPNKPDGSAYSREEIKSKMFLVLFTNNEATHQKWASFKREFAKVFPGIFSIICLIQAGGADKLPVLLQRIESYLFYYRILPVLKKDFPNLPVFTIHDSIVTVHGQEDAVAEVMLAELQKGVGLPVALKIEDWRSDHLEASLSVLKEVYRFLLTNPQSQEEADSGYLDLTKMREI